MQVPESVFYYAKVLEERHGLDVAHSHYETYLRIVADGAHPPWRMRLVNEAKSKAP